MRHSHPINTSTLCKQYLQLNPVLILPVTSKNAIFCFPCCFFSTNANNKFVKIGYCDWKHTTGKTGALAKHSVSEKHQEAMAAWSAFNTQPHTSVASLLDNNRSNLIRKNRHYVKVIIKVILFCAVQEISLRGHREVESLNKGNFLELLELLSDTDEILKAQLRTLPRNATYTSHAIQNEILHILASKVHSIICTQVKEAQYFSISADETRYVSKQEQMSFIVQYFSEYDQSIQEHFLTYIHTTAFDASSLTQYIKDMLEFYDLNPLCIVSQSYDGASVMSGKCTGVQTRVREFVCTCTVMPTF